MKTIIALIVLALVGWGVYALVNKEEAVPETNNNPAAGIEESQLPPEDTATPTTQEFLVTAQNFTFSPATMKVRKGDVVKITLKNDLGTHDLVVEGYNVRTKVLTVGQTETIEFVASQSGTFEYYCSVGSHRSMGMKGALVVE